MQKLHLLYPCSSKKLSFAYTDVGKADNSPAISAFNTSMCFGREHDCMDAGGRATQEQLPRSGSFAYRDEQKQTKDERYKAKGKSQINCL